MVLLHKLIVISMFIMLANQVNGQLKGDDAWSQKYDSTQIQKLKTLGVDFLHVHLNEGYSNEKHVIATIYEVGDTLYLEKLDDGEEIQLLKFTGTDVKNSYHDVLTNFAMLESRDCKQYYEYLKPEDSWKKIGIARNQWNIFYFNSQNYSDFRYGFKHRLLRFKCLPLSDNLRQRKKINSFLKLLRLK